MEKIEGSGLSLAQFVRDEAPQNSLSGVAKWVRDYGCEAAPPTRDNCQFDLDKVYENQTSRDDFKGQLKGVAIEHVLARADLETELDDHILKARDCVFDASAATGAERAANLKLPGLRG